MSQLQTFETQPQGRIDWLKVYHKDEVTGKKFERLPTPLPWTDDFQQNVVDTLEWLYRSGAKADVRYHPDPLFHEATDGWYRSERLPGEFYHVCYADKMLSFRGRYDGLFQDIEEKADLANALNRISLARRVLWSAWMCYGSDGSRVEPKPNDIISIADDDNKYAACDFEGKIPYAHWKQAWNYKCSRCQVDLPKSIRLSIFLELKLSKAIA